MAFPVVASKGTVYSTAGSTQTSFPTPYPSGIQAGDLLLVIGGVDGSAAMTMSASGFTDLIDVRGASELLYVAYKIATGSESGTLAVTPSVTEQATMKMWRITGWHGTTPPEATSFIGATSANANPPSLTASWGSADNLWIACMAVNGGPGTVSVWSLPDNTEAHETGGSGAAGHAACSDELAQATLDPGTFTQTSQSYVAGTVVIRPAGAVAPKSDVAAFQRRNRRIQPILVR